MKTLSLSLILAFGLVGCDGGTKDDTSSTGGDPVAGEEVYTTYCVACHGADGTLGVDGATDLTVEVPELSDDELHDVIADGYESMPAQTTDETKIADCIAYMRELFP